MLKDELYAEHEVKYDFQSVSSNGDQREDEFAYVW
jgi:hypothetical protein